MYQMTNLQDCVGSISTAYLMTEYNDPRTFAVLLACFVTLQLMAVLWVVRSIGMMVQYFSILSPYYKKKASDLPP